MRLTFLAVALWLVCAATAQAAAPANDAYANAATLTVGAAVTGDTVDATQEAGEPTPFPLTFPGVSCDPTQFGTCAGSVWYTFTAPSTGTFALTDCDWATDFPTVIAVYSGDGLASSKSAASGSFTAPCTTAGTNVVPNVQFSATQGTTYHVQVGGVFGDSGVFGLRVYPAASPPASPPVDTLVDANASLVPRQAGYTQPVHSGVRRSASFAFYARLNDATFECSLDGAPFSACTSPVAYDDITSGRHEFAVRAAVGQGVDPTPARQIFTVDAAPPDTLVGADRYPAAVPTGAATFACSTDGLAGACPFPSSLCAGQHTVTATAISPAGAVDVTQASGTFTGGGGTCAAPSLIDDDVDVDSVGATFAQLNVTVTAAGLPVTARLDYGPTTSYGSSVEGFGNQFNDYVRLPRLRYLTPATTYHYRVTLTDSAGSTSTDDLTFTTKAAPAVLPTVTTGTPVFVGRHAMRVPLTLTDPLGSDLRWGVVVSQSGQPDVEIDAPSDTDEAGPVSVSVVDLDPNAQLQVRGIVTGPETVQGNSVSITTPAPPAPQPTPTAPAGSPAPTASPSPTPAASPSPSPSPKPAAFKLRRANVRVGKVARRAGTIAVRLRGVPSGTRVVVVAKLGGKRLGRGAGKRKAVVRLSHKARRTLRGNRSRKLRLTVTAAPPGGTTSAVTISQRLKKPR